MRKEIIPAGSNGEVIKLPTEIRRQHLADISSSPDWISDLETNFPDVIDAGEIQSQLGLLNNLSREHDRQKRWTRLTFGAVSGFIGGFFVGEQGPTPEVRSIGYVVAVPSMLWLFIGLTFFGPHEMSYWQHKESWDNLKTYWWTKGQ